MPIFFCRNPETNEECQLEVQFEYTTSLEDAKTRICDRLGVDLKKYNLVYKDEIILNQKSLQELDLVDDPRPTLSIARISKSAKPISAFSLLGLPGLGGGASNVAAEEDESERETKIPQPLPRYTEAGVLEDPTKFSVARNSSFAYRIHTLTKQMYSPEDSEKLMETLTSEIQSIVDSLSYDELEQLARECLQINQRRMENLRDQYYSSFEEQT